MDRAAQQPDFAEQVRIAEQWRAVNCPGVCHRSLAATEELYGRSAWQAMYAPNPSTPAYDLWQEGFAEASQGAFNLLALTESASSIATVWKGRSAARFADDLALPSAWTAEFTTNLGDLPAGAVQCLDPGSTLVQSGEFLTFFRGDRSGTNVFKSYAARAGGYRYSQSLIETTPIDELMLLHAIDSTDPPSPFISITADPQVARFFAGDNGVVLELSLPSNRAIYNVYNDYVVPAGPKNEFLSEQEWLVPNYIRPSEIVRKTQVGD